MPSIATCPASVLGRALARFGERSYSGAERPAPGRRRRSEPGTAGRGRTIAVFFTSDTHFGHGGALGLFRRPFGSVAEMDATLVERWNARVRAADRVWHLGDFSVRPKAGRIGHLLGLLAGEKHLIIGNTDSLLTTGATGWASVGHYAEVTVDEVPLVLCHYPLRSWNRQSKGAWNLHGHSHGRLRPLARQVDVGVDVFDFRPVIFEEIRTWRSALRRPPRPAGGG